MLESDKLWEAQLRTLKMLESHIVSIENSVKDLKSKTQHDKLTTNYSMNNDCLEYAIKIWKCSMRLCELRTLQWELEGRDSNGKLINKNNEEK
jgi:hypothetical protein